MDMTRRELNMAIFRGTAEGVLWQPRLETWIRHHKTRGTFPKRFQGLSKVEIYDALGCSIRYPDTTLLDRYYTGEIQRIEEQHSDKTLVRICSPSGELLTVYQDIWEDGVRVNHRIREFAVRSLSDLGVLTDVVENTHFRVNPEAFLEGRERMAHRGEPTMVLTGSGLTELIKEWAGLLGTYYLLHDFPREVEAYLEACDRLDDRLIDQALELPCHLFGLGDHANNEFTPPSILRKYLIPRWQRISDRLHAEGRFVHTHWDGNSVAILPFLRETRLDGVEALTPEPMGDMSLRQIKDAVGNDMVVLDLLPAIDFLPNHPLDELLDFAAEVIQMFAPRLILGISDEISEIGEIEKVEAVSELVDGICGLAR